MRFCNLKYLLPLLLVVFITTGCPDVDPVGPEPGPGPDPLPDPERSGESAISYQLLVYSFADSDGDGTGDFNGIREKLGYLKDLGVQALWLSPIHPATSYHGYDVEDYNTVNPEYGTESDFKSLLDAAHSEGIKVYIDFVLNHTSKNHPWFLEALSDSSSAYRDYYFFSKSPSSTTSWTQVSSGASGPEKVLFTLICSSSGQPQTLTVSKVDNVVNVGTQSGGKYLWWGDSNCTQFYKRDERTYTLALELDSPWGVLVRTSTTQWDSYKWGAPAGANTLEWDKPMTLSNSANNDILLPGMNSYYYYSFFGSYMPDINYGPASTCDSSKPFEEMVSSAEKWIKMGVDGFRLDAVKHIYDNSNSDENPLFLKKFYDRCNSAYKSAGHADDLYMVGEQFSEANQAAPYYRGIPALFEFAFWWRLKDAVNIGTGASFAPTIQGYRTLYSQYRTGYIAATKLSNHDEDRAASDLGRLKDKIKLAGAVLLTAGGEPYIYQGEELGYWGKKSSGDEYVRTPVNWKSDGSSFASAALGGKVDNSLHSSAMSVESELADESSVLNLYRKFGQARDRYQALAKGDFVVRTDISLSAISAWTRSYNGQKVLVLHNFSTSEVSFNLPSDKLSEIVVSNGTVSVSGTQIKMGALSSAVLLQ